MLNRIAKLLNLSLSHLRYDGRAGHGESVPGGKGRGYCRCRQRMNMMRRGPSHAAPDRYEGSRK